VCEVEELPCLSEDNFMTVSVENLCVSIYYCQASGADVLAQLVSLLKEFYTTNNNSRKKEIGKMSFFSHF